MSKAGAILRLVELDVLMTKLVDVDVMLVGIWQEMLLGETNWLKLGCWITKLVILSWITDGCPSIGLDHVLIELV